MGICLLFWVKVILSALVAIGIALFGLWWYFWSGKREGPHKKDWKQDVVYLYQFPRPKFIPNFSPYCLKLETWLRMAKIPYEVISTTMSSWSKHGQLPFVELNGVEYYDSGLIIRDLSRIFNKTESDFPAEQEGAARAFEQMVEIGTFWSYTYVRIVEHVDEVADLMGYGGLRKFLFTILFPKLIRRKLHHHGIGRHSRHEIVNIGLDDLRALSKYMGDKKFLMGSQPSKFDATLFGSLAQMVFLSIETPHGKLIEEECQNLKAFSERMKEMFWADWDDVCRKSNN